MTAAESLAKRAEAKARSRARLPKWAQDELDRLERSVEWWKAKANEGPADSDTFRSTAYGELAQPLGAGPIIEYRSGDDIHYDVHMDDGRLIVSLYSSMSRCLLVRPRADNAIVIQDGRP